MLVIRQIIVVKAVKKFIIIFKKLLDAPQAIFGKAVKKFINIFKKLLDNTFIVC